MTEQTIGFEGMCSLEAAVRRLDALSVSPTISDEARMIVAWALSDLVPVIDLNPGPTVAVFNGDDLDVEAVASTIRDALSTLVVDLCDPTAMGLTPMDVVSVSAALGDASALIPELVPAG